MSSPDKPEVPPLELEKPTRPHEPPNHALLKVVRILIYLAPAGTLVALTATVPIIPYGEIWMGFVATLIITYGIGLFDGLFAPEVPKTEGTPNITELIHHAFWFLAVQLLLAPGIIFVVLIILSQFFI